MGLITKLLAASHNLLAKSKNATYVAAKIRGQCDLIIRKRFSAADMDPSKNGEHLLLQSILSYCTIYFDVGANKGEWTNFIVKNKKDNFYKCYLFEPGTAAFAYLIERFNSDFIGIKNIAVSNSPGMIDFYEEENAGEMSSAIKGWANHHTKAIRVGCTTIDEEIIENEIPFLDFLKIDVEGFDLKVIEGALQSIRDQKIGFIQFEYNACWFNTGSSLSGAYQILTANNYKIYLINPKGLVKYDIHTYGEFYSFSNFLAVSDKSHRLIKNLIL